MGSLLLLGYWGMRVGQVNRGSVDCGQRMIDEFPVFLGVFLLSAGIERVILVPLLASLSWDT